MNSFGKLIQTERLRRNLSLRDVAKEADVSHGYLSSIEKGSATASLAVKASICRVLGISDASEPDASIHSCNITVFSGDDIGYFIYSIAKARYPSAGKYNEDGSGAYSYKWKAEFPLTADLLQALLIRMVKNDNSPLDYFAQNT